MRACAAIAFAFTNAPHDALAGEPQEHVLERTPTRAQLAQQHAPARPSHAVSAATSSAGVARRVDEVVARAQLTHRIGREPEVRGERPTADR